MGKINVQVPHQRSPHALKFEDRSRGETERQQRCARSKAWNLAKNINKLKANDKATFFSPAKWVLPSASARESEEREFEVDSRASMHMVSEKDLNFAELETMRTSRSPTTVITGNGLDLFVTVMLLQENPAVLPLEKLCEEHGYTCHWKSGRGLIRLWDLVLMVSSERGPAEPRSMRDRDRRHAILANGVREPAPRCRWRVNPTLPLAILTFAGKDATTEFDMIHPPDVRRSHRYTWRLRRG